MLQLTLKGIARLLFIRVEFVDNSCHCCVRKKRQKDCESSNNGEATRMLCTKSDCFSAFRKKKSSDSAALFENMTESSSSSSSLSLLQSEVVAIKRSLDRMETKLAEKTANTNYHNMAAKEWKECAMVLDRFFFVVYLLLIAVSLTVFFPRPQY